MNKNIGLHEIIEYWLVRMSIKHKDISKRYIIYALEILLVLSINIILIWDKIFC